MLLTTNGTSGAAELFAAALLDNKRATLVGEHTLGRAGVQKLVKLPDGSALYMTVARYLAPGGASIHGTGLTPTRRRRRARARVRRRGPRRPIRSSRRRSSSCAMKKARVIARSPAACSTLDSN